MIKINKRTNTNIEEINLSIPALISQWDVSESDNRSLFNQIVGLQIRKIRLMRKKTQTKLAKKISVTFQQIQKYEKGLNACSYMNLKMIAEYLNVSIDYFTKPIDYLNLKLLTKRRDNGYYNNRAWTPDRV